MSTPIPNPIKVTPYLTIIPGRRPEQKVHVTLGHAKNAINNACYNYSNEAYYDLFLYEYTADGWKVLHSIPKGSKRGELPWQVAE